MNGKEASGHYLICTAGSALFKRFKSHSTHVDDLVMAKAVPAKDTPRIPAFLEHTAKSEKQIFQTLDPQSKCVITMIAYKTHWKHKSRS